MTAADAPWYARGLCFECTGCGACCRTHGDCEYVFLTDGDVAAIARHLAMSRVDFLNEHCESDPTATWLVMPSAACIFLEDGARCRVYPARPVQCATWPFWTENLRSQEAWERQVLAVCPGAGRGRRHSREEIEQTARARDARYGIDFHT